MPGEKKGENWSEYGGFMRTGTFESTYFYQT